MGEYSLHLLQQQEFRLSCRVAHRCLELFQKQQLEQQRIRHEQQQQDNWNHLAEDLYDNDDDDGQSPLTPIGGNHNGGLFVLDPATNQPAQIPGLWYIEMHLANCYHTWGQSNMALYHINRTLDQLGNYKINPDALTVRLNTQRKFKLLSSYLVQSTVQKQEEERLSMKRKKEQRKNKRKLVKMNSLELKENDEDGGGSKEKGGRRRSFMKRIKVNNRRRRKSNVFSKLFDRFSGNSKK